jgi:chromosome segregation ATPase
MSQTLPDGQNDPIKLRQKLENAEESLDDIFSEVCDRASHDPNASSSEKLAQRVLSHIEFYHQEKSGLKVSWKDKQIAGLEESLSFAKESIEKKDADITALREENANMKAAIEWAHRTITYLNDMHCDNKSTRARAALAQLHPFLP